MARKPIDQDLTGKICVVTGGSSGIGKEIARNLARMNATVIIAARDFSRGEAAKSDLIVELGSRERIHFMELDLTRAGSIREFYGLFLERFDRIDLLVQNAAVYLPEKFETPDGFDRVWQTNVLGPHILMNMYMEMLKRCAPSRVVFVSCSDAGGLDLDDVDFDQRSYSGAKAYRQSKQAQRLLAMSWAEKLALYGVSVNSCIPGSNIKTDLYRYAKGLGVSVSRLMASSPVKAADTPTWLATNPELQTVNGKLFVNRKANADKLRKPDEMTQLWAVLDRQMAHLEGVDLLEEGSVQRERSGFFNPSGMTDRSGVVSVNNLMNQAAQRSSESSGGVPVASVQSSSETSGFTPNPLNSVRGGGETSGFTNPLNAVRGENSAVTPNPLNAVRGNPLNATPTGSHQVVSAAPDPPPPTPEPAPEPEPPPAPAGFVPAYMKTKDDTFDSNSPVFVPALMKESDAEEREKRGPPAPPEPPPAPADGPLYLRYMTDFKKK